MVDIYKIETVADFLKVPEDRLDDCLKEFAAWVVISKSMIGFSDSCGAGLEVIGFTWVDDGKNDITVNIHTEVRGAEC